MYKIVGADLRAYGPVPVEQVRKWIAEGRANAQTRACTEGGEWKSLGQFPEFADALVVRGALAPPLPPKLAGLEAEKLVAEIVGRDYRLDIGDCFSRSWSLVRDNFWMLVGATALTLMMEVALAFVPGLGVAAAVFLALLFQGGLQWLFLKCAGGERISGTAI